MNLIRLIDKAENTSVYSLINKPPKIENIPVFKSEIIYLINLIPPFKGSALLITPANVFSHLDQIH